ncbi:pentapeptide repeat-containing protein [Azospirillum sp. sgz302134]
MVTTLIIGTLIFAAAFFVVYAFAPKRLISDLPDKGASESEIKIFELRAKEEERHRAILSASLTVIGAAIAFVYGVYKDVDTKAEQKEHELSTRKMENRKETVAQMEKYMTALSGSDPFVKASAIYSIGNLSKIDSDLNNATSQSLTLYIRNHTEQEPEKIKSGEKMEYKKISQDIQAAIDVLGWNDYDRGFRAIDFSHLYLIQPNFHGTGAYHNSLFSGATILRADMRDANFEYSKFDGANFGDWRAFGAPSENDHHAPDRSTCQDEEDKGWSNEISRKSCWWDWMRYNYSANFTRSHLKGATFIGAGLEGAVFDEADLEKADFSGANISRADFSNSNNLDKAIFKNVCGVEIKWPEKRPKNVPAQICYCGAPSCP